MENFVLTCDFTPETPSQLSGDLVRFLQQKAGENWQIIQKKNAEAQTIKEKKDEKQNLLIHELEKTPVIAQALQSFVGSKVSKVKMIRNLDISEQEDETETI